MPTARNDDELRRNLRKDLRKVVDYVVQKIWNENRDVIRHTVYMAGVPAAYYTTAAEPIAYHRTYQFLEAWGTTSASTSVSYITGNVDARGIFHYKPSELHAGSVDPFDDSFGQHVGIAGKYKGESSAPYLADILYEGISGGSAWNDKSHWSHRKRDAYSELINRIGKRNLKHWILDGFNFYGIPVISHNTPIQFKQEHN